MVDIAKSSIQLMASQRLDDTEQGGGQMTATLIPDGQINNLFPDKSRMDCVYGNVSLRKAYGYVNTNNRATYYGAHAVLTKQVTDPHVSVCFFSSNDWYDTREDAKTRIESYLVKGPFYPGALWGDHFRGTRILQVQTAVGWGIPVVGDVIILIQNAGLSNEKSQFCRITDVSKENKQFITTGAGATITYYKQIIYLTIGDALTEDFTGEEVFQGTDYAGTNIDTRIYTTVAADASRYYGVTTLKENAVSGNFQFQVADINVPLVPSAQSESSITDAGVGQAVTPMLQTKEGAVALTRSVAYNITANSKLFIGEGVLPGSFSWTGGISLTEDSKGNVYSGSTIVGSIFYDTGVIVFGDPGITSSGNGTATYIPACSPVEVSDTGGIQITISNRGFVYVYNCNPLPKRGTLKIDYLAGGKWYSIWDQGNGSISGSDPAIGAGQVNYITGSVSVTLGAMPDIGSTILFFWAKDAPFYDLSGESLPILYSFVTANVGITRNTLRIGWSSDTVGVMDNGIGDIVKATIVGENWTATANVVGEVKYATGEVTFGVHSTQAVPLSTESFHIVYSYGDKYTETFNPLRNPNGTVDFYLTNIPVKPGTVKLSWHTMQQEYDGTSGLQRMIDPTHIFIDNSSGGFKNDSYGDTVNYTTGQLHVYPDRTGTFPVAIYMWYYNGLYDLNHNPLKEYKFHHIEYRPAACLWPTDGEFEVSYSTTDGANTDDYYLALPKKFYIKENSNLELVPGSVKCYADTTYITEVGSGKMFTGINGTTGIGTEVGLINYVERSITITSNTITSRNLTVSFASGTAAIDPVAIIAFRCPGAPIVPTSLGIRATLGTGTVITGTSNLNGEITGTGIVGTVDYNTGICYVSFGEWIEDIYEIMLPEERPEWYADAPLDGNGNVWHPFSVRASTILLNCVITSYLPLDENLLGLNPVRLPLDGKVPIFRDGYIVLVHHTLEQNLPNPITPGETYNISRTNVNLLEIYDTPDPADPDVGYVTDVPEYVPDGGNYTVDLAAGTVTFSPTFNPAPYRQPFIARHRIEDMCLASDVQVTGHISVTNHLTHNYPKDETLVSSVLPVGNMQSRAYNEFTQATWTGVWSDDRIGSLPLANYDFVNYPIIVTNEGATKERWLLRFQTTTTLEVIGEKLGVLRQGFNITVVGQDLTITNTLTGKVLFTIRQAGFGTGWAAGNCIRFNTDAANYPYWFVRTTLQAPSEEPFDHFEFQQRGDSA